MGLIYTSRNDSSMRELTTSRSIAALPVAGRYRMIDFILSDLVNTGIRNVGIIMQKNYHSLMDHLGSGMEWDLHTKNEGLFILPPFLTRTNTGSYTGLLDAVRANRGYLNRSSQEYVILTNSHTVLTTTFDDFIRFHEESHADITLMASRKKPGELDETVTITPRHVYLDTDNDGVVKEVEIGPTTPSCPLFYMDILIMRRELLLRLADEAFTEGVSDMNREIIQHGVQSKELRVCAYEYKGYNKRVETINSYFNLNLQMLNADNRRDVFGKAPVYTKVRDEVPARYIGDAKAANSLVADGCIIEGTVENSVLFRGVKVGKGSVIRNSIIMQGCRIGKNTEIENVIFDKHVSLSDGKRLITTDTYPIVVGKGKEL